MLQKFIAGDDVDRKRLISDVNFDKHFIPEIKIIESNANMITEGGQINEISSRTSRAHGWSDLFPIPGNKADTKDWLGIYKKSKPQFAIDEKNPFLCYLYSLARYPVIPEEHWINICAYTKYTYDEFSLQDLLFRNGQRSVLAREADLTRINTNHTINFLDPSNKTDLSYSSGSWIVGAVALTDQDYSEEDYSLVQYAACLDSAKEVTIQFDRSLVSNGIRAFAADARIQDLNKIVSLFAILESKIFDHDVLDALCIMNSSAAPSSQLGMINVIKHRNKDADISKLHESRQKDLVNLTKLWIEKMSLYHEAMIYDEEDIAESFYLGVLESAKLI